MVWPTTLTTDQDIEDIVYLPDLQRMKKPSDNYDGLHQAVSLRIRQWYQEKYGNPDLEQQPLNFKRAAAFLFAATLFEQRDQTRSGRYYGVAKNEFRVVESDRNAPNDFQDSGPNPEVYLANPGSSGFYNRQNANSAFYNPPPVGPGSERL